MSENFVKAIRAAEIAPGGMKAVELSGRELVVCNCDGSFHAIDRRCGHMNAPLEMGTLDGSILTCAMHGWRFELATGRCLTSDDRRLHCVPIEDPTTSGSPSAE